MRFTRSNRSALKSQPSNGNLYYVRLKTSLGVLYKLGFTTLGSVQERFAYQGNGHDALVDEVLLFAFRDDAYEVEQLLHQHFRNKAAFSIPEEGMPFFENGQSELYAEDILEMDLDVAIGKGKRNAEDTKTNITTARGKRSGRSDQEIRDQLELERNILDVMASLAKTFRWIVIGYQKLEEWNASDSERARRAQIRKVRFDLAKLKDEHWRGRRRRKTNIMSDPYAALQADIREAIAAFKRKDLHAFEEIIHVPLFAHNLADGMTADMGFGSDYMGVASNCGLFALIDAMGRESPRNLLLKPVEETYKAVLRVVVKSHRLLREDLIMPDDPKYYVSEAEGDYEYDSLSRCYGPGTFLELFGREWTLLDNPSFDIKVGTVEFNVEVFNRVTGFRGPLTINAMYVSNNRLSLSFPNFLDLEEDACQHRTKWEKSVGLRDPDEAELPHRNYFRRMMMQEMKELNELGK